MFSYPVRLIKLSFQFLAVGAYYYQIRCWVVTLSICNGQTDSLPINKRCVWVISCTQFRLSFFFAQYVHHQPLSCSSPFFYHNMLAFPRPPLSSSPIGKFNPSEQQQRPTLQSSASQCYTAYTLPSRTLGSGGAPSAPMVFAPSGGSCLRLEACRPCRRSRRASQARCVLCFVVSGLP